MTSAAVSIPHVWTRVPWVVVGCALGLLCLGLCGIARGDEVMGGAEFYHRQMVWIVLALPVLFLATTVNYRILARWSYPLFAIALVLLVLVFFFRPINGARRWIPLGFFSFQPSEVAKLAYILTLASYLRFRENFRRVRGLAAPFALTLLPVGLILKEPNLGTALLFFPILYAMLFAAGAHARHLLAAALLGLALTPFAWFGMSAEQQSRVTALFHQTDGGPAPRGDNYHLHQAKQMLAHGGVWGSRYEAEAADSAVLHLPESRTDFVFCMVGERFGIVGTLGTLGIYLVLFGRGLGIAAATREPFGRLVAVGIVAWLATQTAINTGMTVGLTPITGITLPLLSYGGSSLLTTCVGVGLLINIGMRPGYEIAAVPFQFEE